MSALTDQTELGPAGRPTLGWRFNRWLERHLPSDLYRRSLIIVIAPMVLLQSIMAFTFMERHWDNVTKSLSKSVSREFSFIINLYESGDRSAGAIAELQKLANDAMGVGLQIQPQTELPPPPRKPFFSLLDQQLSKYVDRFVARPFWIDTLGQSGYVDIRILTSDGTVFRFLTNQKRAYASNSHIFLLWMVGSSLVLLFVAIVFLRKQIRPILQLAEAAQSFGMGREVENFEPRGAAEVRNAAHAFLNMKRRIERHVEQRTAMLAGVSHDLRTVLTRFKLELALIEAGPHREALREDVEEMERMLEGYIAFVRGDGGETSETVDVRKILTGVVGTMKRSGLRIKLICDGKLEAPVKPDAFRRCISNLVSNAARFAKKIELSAQKSGRYLIVTVDDDGIGIPAEKREDVFRPFFRLEDGRNQDEGNTGLGLAIARDIAQSHGGDITLGDSALGGLRARVRLP
ncbi:MAG: ATP-binding protein, partial [Aestuariivirgaceae bacterium]